MRHSQVISIAALLGASSAAHAAIAFSFADPIPGRQITCIANGAGTGIGMMHYDTNAALTFLVDATEEGLGVHSFTNARLEMSISIQPAVSLGGTTTAVVQGTWTVYDFTNNVRTNILTGTTQTLQMSDCRAGNPEPARPISSIRSSIASGRSASRCTNRMWQG